jgi:hypothetical protein
LETLPETEGVLMRRVGLKGKAAKAMRRDRLMMTLFGIGLVWLGLPDVSNGYIIPIFAINNQAFSLSLVLTGVAAIFVGLTL